MEHIYSVTANTTKGGIKWRRIIVVAKNQSEAKAIAKDEWDHQRGDCHLFRLTAHRTDINPTHSNTLWHITDVKTPSGNWITYV